MTKDSNPSNTLQYIICLEKMQVFWTSNAKNRPNPNARKNCAKTLIFLQKPLAKEKKEWYNTELYERIRTSPLRWTYSRITDE